LEKLEPVPEPYLKRMLVGRLRQRHLAGDMVGVEVALARPVDAVGPVQAGVEPLRAVGGAELHGEHVAVLVEEGARVVLAGEIAALPAPVGPGAGEPVEHLTRVVLADDAFGGRALRERALIGHRAPQPGRDLSFLDALEACGHTGLAEILLRQDVGRDLAPMLGDGEALQPEDDGTVRVLDLGGGAAERDLVVG
jgi:hypothetical protein